MTQNPPPKSGAVFLSYAREDADAAKRIAEALRAFGVEVWFDLNELRGGDTWDTNIRNQIKGCALFLPIVSAQTEERTEGYFRREWKIAVDRTHDMAGGRVFLVPVVIDHTPETGAAVPEEFLRVQWTSLPDGEPTPAFIEQVKRLLSREPRAGSQEPSRSRAPVAGVADPGRPASEPGSTTPATTKSFPRWLWAALAAAVVGVVATLTVSRKPEPAPTAPIIVPSSAATPDPKSRTPDPSRPPAANAKSIAVLPFENRSENKGDLYFTDGIHDDLLTQISRIKDIKTISRTSVMTYRGSAKKISEIAGELGVATILEGGVQRAGNQVRINVQLIDAATDAHLWAETYTRDLTAENIFAIQSEIATSIATALKAALSSEEQQQLDQRATSSLAALEQYFAANALVRDGNTEKLERAMPLYQEAIRLDPGFAPAYARLAELYIREIYYSGLPSEAQLLKAEPLIDRSLRLDPRLSEAHTSRGYLLSYRDDFPGAKAAYERAIELKPNNDAAYLGLARLLFWRDNSSRERALALARRAQELNPEDPNVNRDVAELLAEGERGTEARAILEKLVRENPRDALSLAGLGLMDFHSGNRIGGFVTLRKAYALDPGSAVIAENILQICIDELGDETWVKFWLERSVASTRVGKAPLISRVRLLIRQGKLAEADALWMQEWEMDQRGDSMVLWELMLADVKAGRNLAPQARYLKTNPELFAADAKVSDASRSLFRAKDVALSLIAAGKRDQAARLLEQAGNLARGHTESLYRFILAKIQLAQGDRNAFFQTLHGLAGDKRQHEFLYHDPEFAVYREDPEFKALIGDVPRRRAELIATLHRMDASGELAPVPPLPEKK